MFDFISKLIPDSIKLPALGVVCGLLGAAAMYYPAKWIGASDERKSAQIEAINNAADRIKDLETNNEKFRNLPSRQRCILMLRDSGLPTDRCTQR